MRGAGRSRGLRLINLHSESCQCGKWYKSLDLCREKGVSKYCARAMLRVRDTYLQSISSVLPFSTSKSTSVSCLLYCAQSMSRSPVSNAHREPSMRPRVLSAGHRGMLLEKRRGSDSLRGDGTPHAQNLTLVVTVGKPQESLNEGGGLLSSMDHTNL